MQRKIKNTSTAMVLLATASAVQAQSTLPSPRELETIYMQFQGVICRLFVDLTIPLLKQATDAVTGGECGEGVLTNLTCVPVHYDDIKSWFNAFNGEKIAQFGCAKNRTVNPAFVNCTTNRFGNAATEMGGALGPHMLKVMLIVVCAIVSLAALGWGGSNYYASRRRAIERREDMLNSGAFPRQEEEQTCAAFCGPVNFCDKFPELVENHEMQEPSSANYRA